MNRKRFVSLVPLLAVMAFAAVPAVAQAAPHWYKKNVIIGPSPVTVTTIGGAITLNVLSATISCNVADSEEIWNPVGGSGQDLVTGFALTGCKNKTASAACPKGPLEVKSEGLGWPSRLITTPPPGSVIRDEILKIRLNVGCAGTSGTVGDVFEGSLSPEVGNGTLIFGGPGGGTLTDSGSNPLTVSGLDKLGGPPKGKIRAKDP
jgi:hypothetical protein